MEKISEMTHQEYNSILDNLMEGIVVHDSDACILFANKQAQNILGIDEELLTGNQSIESYLHFLNEDSSAMSIENYPVNRVIATKKELRNYIVGVKRSDLSYITWCKTNARPLFSNGNELDKIIVNFIEIKEFNQLEKKEIQVEEKFRQLIKNSFDTLVLLDSDGIQRFVSESCEKSHGYRPDELTNISVIDEMIHPDDQEKVVAEFQNILNNTGFGGVQYRHRAKNGGWVYLEAFGSNQIYNPHINAVVLNVRDITERKIAEQKLKENETRLQELNATKDKFFSIIAHDLISPFHSIIGFSDLLSDQLDRQDYEGLEKYVTIIKNSSQLALDLLLNLLEWSRMQTGRVEFNPEYFEIVKLIKEVSNLLIGFAEQKSITIYLELPHNLPVFADKAMISTILRNLISNGIKFTNSGGEITISAEQEDDQLVVSVSDNGIGIKPEAIDKLFRIEESYSTIGTRNEKGTGLGLLLCKEFVEKHDGELWIESEVSKGSIFKFTIPRQI